MKFFDVILFLTLFLGTSAVPLTPEFFKKMFGKKMFGSDETERIVGGINATQGQFPFLVSIPVFFGYERWRFRF